MYYCRSGLCDLGHIDKRPGPGSGRTCRGEDGPQNERRPPCRNSGGRRGQESPSRLREKGFPLPNVTPGEDAAHLSAQGSPESPSATRYALESWGRTVRLCMIRLSFGAAGVLAWIVARR
jgi:hypothetical protein